MERLTGQIDAIIGFNPLYGALIALASVFALAAIANWITKKIVVRLIKRAVAVSPLRDESLHIGQAVTHLSNVVPAIVIQQGIVLVEGIPEKLVTVTQSLASAFIIFTVARALCDVLDLVNDTYEDQPDAATRPIKGYIQVGKIVIYAAAIILIVASLTGESPLLLLSGLGAMAAVILLIFRDTILSLVASVQLRSNDMIRVGDWIEMPQFNADGDVIDISLHTVKVQNFDKTVTTIPTHKLVSDSYRNWRFMRDWGGRRIKRSLFIDKSTIGFLSAREWEKLRRFALLQPYMKAKQAELDDWNASHAPGDDGEVNKRRPTNIGSFRAYVIAYLKAHPRISSRGTLLVRQLDPTEKGLPLQIYCFTDTTAWAEYEGIQADIFDHLLAIMPEFGLHAFQQPSGRDLRALGTVFVSAAKAKSEPGAAGP